MKRILSISVVLIVLLAGCAESSVEEVDTSPSTNQTNVQENNTQRSNTQTNDTETSNTEASDTQTSNSEDSQAQQVYDAPGTFKMGDTVKVDNLHITLHGVREESGAEPLLRRMENIT